MTCCIRMFSVGSPAAQQQTGKPSRAPHFGSKDKSAREETGHLANNVIVSYNDNTDILLYCIHNEA